MCVQLDDDNDAVSASAMASTVNSCRQTSLDEKIARIRRSKHKAMDDDDDDETLMDVDEHSNDDDDERSNEEHQLEHGQLTVRLSYLLLCVCKQYYIVSFHRVVLYCCRSRICEEHYFC